jgi:MerR family transcriptional regulator, copper efflux regulator
MNKAMNKSVNKAMNIGELARRTDVPTKTIRYYEDIGLLPAPSRSSKGYRNYDDRALHTLRFVKHAREFGFSIDDVRELLALWANPRRASAKVKAVAQKHVEEIERKLEKLASMRRTLMKLIQCCHGDHRPDCPILDDLARGGAPTKP